MATYNANTVREEARLEELAHCAEDRGVEILAVQEHRRVHTDQTINYRRVGGRTFITSSAWRNDAQAATGGVGLMVSPRARKALRRVHSHTNRILSADFEGNPVTTVMSVYSPTNVAPIEEVEKFYDDLRTAADPPCAGSQLPHNPGGLQRETWTGRRTVHVPHQYQPQRRTSSCPSYGT